MVAPTEAAWWSLAALQHVASLFLVLVLAVGAGVPVPPGMRRIAGRTTPWFRAWSVRHAAVLGLAVAVGGIALHAFTLLGGGVGNYGDLRGWWIPAAEATLAGGNPYAPPAGEAHTWSNALNYGILFPGLLAIGYGLAGPLGIVAILVAFAALVPVLAFLVTREVIPEASSPVPGIVAVLSVTLPQAVYFQVWGVQDELVTVVAVLATLWLVLRDRVLWAGLAAGLGASVKYLSLPILAVSLALWWRDGGPDPRRGAGSQRTLAAAGALAAATAVVAAGLAIGFGLYGRAFLRRTAGMGGLLDAPRTVTLADSLGPALDPGLMTAAAGVGFAGLLVHLLAGPDGPDPRGARYPGAVVAVVGLFILLFPKVNPDFVTFAVVPGLVLLAARWDALTGPPTWGDVLRSPLLVYAAGALADLLLMLQSVGGYEGNAPLPLEVAFTGVAILLLVTGARWRPWMARGKDPSRPSRVPSSEP